VANRLWVVAMLCLLGFCGCEGPRSSSPPITIQSPTKKVPVENQQALRVKSIQSSGSYKTRWIKAAKKAANGYKPASVTGKVIETSYFDGNTLIRFEDGDYAIVLGYTLRAVPGVVVKVEGDLNMGGCFTAYCGAHPVAVTEIPNH